MYLLYRYVRINQDNFTTVEPDKLITDNQIKIDCLTNKQYFCFFVNWNRFVIGYAHELLIDCCFLVEYTPGIHWKRVSTERK